MIRSASPVIRLLLLLGSTAQWPIQNRLGLLEGFSNCLVVNAPNLRTRRNSLGRVMLDSLKREGELDGKHRY